MSLAVLNIDKAHCCYIDEENLQVIHDVKICNNIEQQQQQQQQLLQWKTLHVSGRRKVYTTIIMVDR